MLGRIDFGGWLNGMGAFLSGIAAIGGFVSARRARHARDTAQATQAVVEHKMTQHDEMINVLASLSVKQQEMANGLVSPFLDWYKKEHGGNGPDEPKG